MKRTHRARRAAVAGALALTTGLAATLGATAANAAPAATVNVSDGSSEPTVSDVNHDALTDALFGLAKSTTRLFNGTITPSVNQTEAGLNIVLDPAAVPGLEDAFTPEGDHSGLSATHSQDANGNTVVFPTTGTLTSGFGSRWGAMHNGIDIANPVGTPIYAVMDGTVISSGPAQGFGNWIRIQHDDGTVSVYGHMAASSLLVGVGERVTAGQQIASIGNEGVSTGPHLHFEVHPGGGAPVDPITWFAERGITV
ncbi:MULTISPECIES: M23 family metallopeptidase [unclassified Corynebacterium]|uniref:M23 family metallopeptidase n=1 Tax=Corynebacterium sp. LK2522 TaxID=3110474 RepID=UPI0034CF66C6